MTRSNEYCHYPLACLSVWIRPAIHLKQITYLFDGAGNYCGYFTWAYLAKDVEKRLISDPDVIFHVSEWNEGSALWIMDCVIIGGTLRDHLGSMLRAFPDQELARYVRRDDQGVVMKVATISRNSLLRRLGRKSKGRPF